MTAPPILARLHAAGVRVEHDSGGTLLHAPSIALTADLLREARGARVELNSWLGGEAAARGTSRIVTAPLSREQERLWFLRKAGSDPALMISLALRFETDAAPWPDALAAAAANHPMLGALFAEDPEPHMVFGDKRGALAERLVDLRELPEAACGKVRDLLLLAHAQRPFDLGREPGIRVLRLLEHGSRAVIQIARHHIVSDGWSLGLLLTAIAEADHRLRQGKPAPAPPRALDYADHACRQRIAVTAARLPPDAVPDRPAHMLGPDRSPGRARMLRRLYDGQAFRQEAGVSRFAVLAGLFSILLSSWLHRAEVVFGIDVATRNRPEHEGCIGTFVNRAPLTLAPPLTGELRPFFQTVARRVAIAAEVAQTPFDTLVAGLGLSRATRRDPMFDIIFGMHSEPHHAPYRHLATTELVPVDDAACHAPLSTYLTVDGDRLHGEIRYDDAFLSDHDADALATAFGLMLSGGETEIGRLRRQAVAAFRSRTRIPDRSPILAAARTGGGT